MSDQTDVVKRVLVGWRRNEDLIEQGVIAEDVVYVNPPEAVESGVRRGHDGWRGAMRSFGGSFEVEDIKVSRIEELGDRVLVLVDFVTRGRGSGVEGRRELGWVFDVRHGQVARFEWHNSHAAALQAATGTG